jgi:hypothetical protein
MNMNTHERRFLVYNVTDGIMAHPDLMTLSEARNFIRHFPERFARQGYYLTWSRERIRPDEVELEIVDTGADPPLSINSQAQPIHRGW